MNASPEVRIAHLEDINAGLVKALKLAAAALHDAPLIGKPYEARHKTRDAFALVAIQAGIGLAEGRPFDPGGTDLSRLLEAARDALTFTLSRAEFNAGDNGKFAHAERVLIDIIRLVGPNMDEAKLLAFARVTAGDAGAHPCDTEI